MLNGGYIIRAEFTDPNFNLLTELVKLGYLRNSRSIVLRMKFQIRWGAPGEEDPDTATRFQMANVVSVAVNNRGTDTAIIEFVAIDPPSWHLNAGDASGKCYRGSVSQVIKQVIRDYAPGIRADVSQTIDSTQNKFWMYRMDPKTFIGSLLDWSSSITNQKTNWVVAMDGDRITISEQAALTSQQRGYYRYWDGPGNDTIESWELINNNALSVAETKIITQGLSAVSGQYLDRSTDQKEQHVFAKDSTTPNKVTARTTEETSFTKPDDQPGSRPPNIGWTSVSAIPEVYSGGEIGLRYEQYIDGRPRGMYLNLINSLMRLRLRVVGHAEWIDGMGLGVDTIFIKWVGEPNDDGQKLYFLSGHWLVYGFHHIVDRRRWHTDLYVARYDYNAISTKVAGSVTSIQ